MTFFSYAQNFEDVMLWRALQHVGKGCYIDVGANDPSVDSVTKAFYERGWRGINIEPLPKHHAELERDRPGDVNLPCAVGATQGELDLWECGVRGWATFEPSVVAAHRAAGYEGTYYRVMVRTLTDICAEYVRGNIHFLKIDVEGFEKPVLEGMDFARFRPWIVVVEATRPNSTEEVHQEWESMVLAADYSLAYCDGLNRFYVAKERRNLAKSLRYPPNVFDGFVRAEQLRMELRAQHAEEQLSMAQEQLSHTQARLAEMYASTSWRVTAPLRLLVGRVRNLPSAPRRIFMRLKMGVKTSLGWLTTRPSVRVALVTSWRWLRSYPSIARHIECSLHKCPRLADRLRWIVLEQTSPTLDTRRAWMRSSQPTTTYVSDRVRQPLTGTDADTDELMLRIEEELAQWRNREASSQILSHVDSLDSMMETLRSRVASRRGA